MKAARLTPADRKFLQGMAALLPKLDRSRRRLLRAGFLKFTTAAARWSQQEARNARRRAARAEQKRQKGGGR